MKKFFEDAVGKMNDGFGVYHHLTTGYEIRPYQQKLIQEVKDTLKEKGKCALGATCGSGKTHITTKIIEDFIVEHPDARVLILTHGRTQLRTQFYKELLGSELLNPEVAKFTSGECPTKRVVVALPHVHKKDLPKFDLVVVDEAHHYYKARMVQEILKKVKPKQLLLLTGSPSYFVKEDFPRVLFSAQELREAQSNVLADVTSFIVQTAYDFKQTDYNKKHQLRGDVPIDLDETKIALSKIIETLLSALRKNVGKNPHLFNGGDNAYQKIQHYVSRKELGKTIIACTSIKQSEQVHSILTEHGVTAVLSHSKNDVDSLEIEKFRKKLDIQILIVVDRGTVGFDLPELKNFIDMSATENPDTMFQMLGRVSRNDQSGQTKVFIKASPKHRIDRVEHVTCFALALSLKEVFEDYKGNYMDTLVPRIRGQRTGEKRGEGGGKTRNHEEQPDVIILPDHTYILKHLKHRDDSPASAVAWVTLNEVFGITPRPSIITNHNIESCMESAASCKTSGEWLKKDSKSYDAARKNGWWDACTKHMTPRRHTFTSCMESAAPHTTKKSWREADYGKYKAAIRKNKKYAWFDKCTAHMTDLLNQRTFESCMESAAPHTNKRSWLEADYDNYKAAKDRNKKYGWFDKCTAHMVADRPKKKVSHTLQSCMESAAPHTNVKAWEKQDRKYFSAASRNSDWWDACTKHMKPLKVRRTLEDCIESAAPHTNVTSWEKQDINAVRIAKQKGWFEECTAHMDK